MINRYTYKDVTWIDILSPTNEEIREIAHEFDLPASFLNDLTTMTPRTETVVKKGAIKITLDFPIVKRTDIKHPHEVKLIATTNTLITIHFEDMEAIDRFTKEFEVTAAIGTAKQKLTGGKLLIAFLSYLYAGLNNKLDYIESKMVAVESEIFDGNEKEMLMELSNLSRRLITFKQVIKSHKNIVNNLDIDLKDAFTARTKFNTVQIGDRYHQAIDRAEVLSKTLDDLKETNNSLLFTKQNEIMKILTIMAFITFPLTLFTSMFGMNTTTTPLIGQKGDFWMIVGIMVIVSIGFFGYFKYKKWM